MSWVAAAVAGPLVMVSPPSIKPDQGYSEFLTRHGLTEEVVWRLMANLSDPIPNAAVDDAFKKAVSLIHGVGMFATRDIKTGECFPACCVAARYNLARYVNHSDDPNCILSFSNTGDGIMTAVRAIRADDEVTMDYNDNMAKSVESCDEYVKESSPCHG